MADPVTRYICTTRSLVDFALEKLKKSGNWTALRLPWMNPDKIQDMMPDLHLPAVSVTHESSKFLNSPRRIANLAVLVLVDATGHDASRQADQLCDEVIACLDMQVLDNALFRVTEFRELYADSTVLIYRLDFQVEDH